MLEGQTKEHTYKPKKTPCADPGFISGNPDGGGGGKKILISIETYSTYDFPGRSRPYSTSGSAHTLIF